MMWLVFGGGWECVGKWEWGIFGFDGFVFLVEWCCVFVGFLCGVGGGVLLCCDV